MKRLAWILALVVGQALTSCSTGTRDLPRSVPPRPEARQPCFDETAAPPYDVWLKRALEAPNVDIDLAEAATVLASYKLRVPQPSSSLPRFLRPVLDRIQKRLHFGSTADDKIEALNSELLPALRLAKSAELEWLNKSLGSKDGACVVNSLLYLIAGDAIGLKLDVVIVPGHSFARSSVGSRRRNIETTDRGQHLSSEEYRRFLLRDPATTDLLPENPEPLERALRTCTRRQFVAVLMCQTGEGADDFEAAARLAPDFYVPVQKLAAHHGLHDNYAQFDEFASRALALAPEVPSLHALRAMSLLQLERPKEALHHVDEALRLAPNAPRLHATKGLILIENLQLGDAVVSLSRAIEGAPRSAKFLRHRAMVFEDLKKHKEAIEDCARAIEMEPLNPANFELRARQWAILGDEAKYEADRLKVRQLSRDP